MEEKSHKIPTGFRKLDIKKRLNMVSGIVPVSIEKFLDDTETMLDMSDVMVENAVGFFPLPMGIATGFLVNGREYDLPMATEEPSVIAAAAFAARRIARCGGFTAEATKPIMAAQVFLSDVSTEQEKVLREKSNVLEDLIRKETKSLEKRGGGFQDLDIVRLQASDIIKVEAWIDVRDAQGANRLNSIAEHVAANIEARSLGYRVMAILTNDSSRRRANARCSIPFENLLKKPFTGKQVAERIATASMIADEDSSRAVTHNKGIMNGITALAMTTGNDTRALEAAVHSYAVQEGRYRGLARWYIEDDSLNGEIDIPLPLATVGGSTRFHPVSRWALELLGNPDTRELAAVAAALGLAQNFAALSALVTDGIGTGHMQLHARKLAWQTGARGSMIATLSKILHNEQISSLEVAGKRLRQLIDQGEEQGN
jgi:hydroxymethylglutaryl-CoA reductase